MAESRIDSAAVAGPAGSPYGYSSHRGWATAVSSRPLFSRRSNCWFVCMLKKISVPLESPDGHARANLERRLRRAQARGFGSVIRNKQDVVGMQHHVGRFAAHNLR